MIDLGLAILGLVLGSIPTILFYRNLRLYLPPPLGETLALQDQPALSVLIPARNEEKTIAGAVQSALASERIQVEVVVLDDHSEDSTAAVVRSIARNDCRVRLETAPPLPKNWCGKQHACFILSRLATHSILVFLDADVRLEPRGLSRAAAFLDTSGADLVSGIPRQVTKSLGEKLLIPLIHFLLLGFLPISRIRKSLHPAYGAGCGQFFMARREAYQHVGGHEAIRQSLHDGLTLPRAFRQKGSKTDLFDATEVAFCRMYRGLGQTWRGLAKNAIEGLASPRVIVPSTLLLLAGQVMPVILCLLALEGLVSSTAGWVSLAAVVVGLFPRLVGTWRFQQSWLGALLHPLGILLLVVIQWQAFFRWLLGCPAGWKGRSYPGHKKESCHPRN